MGDRDRDDRRRGEKDGCKLYVGNLDKNTTKEDLLEEFEKVGKVYEAWVARNPAGFGFVTYEDSRDAQDAIDKMNGKEIGGEKITVEIAKPRRERSSNSRGCFNCGRDGHFARECPDGDRRGGGRGGDRYGDRDRRRSRSRSRDRDYRRDDRDYRGGRDRDDRDDRRGRDDHRRDRSRSDKYKSIAYMFGLSNKHLNVAMIVTSYFVVSISMVLLNKYLGKSAPFFVIWYQCVITVIIGIVLGKLGEKAEPNSFFKQFPKFEYHLPVAQNVMQLSAIYVGMISLNQLCLVYVEVSFYNVARSLTIVFNVILTYFLLGMGTSKATLGTLLIVIIGFLVGTEGEVNVSFYGSLFGVLSSIFVALNGIYSRKAMVFVDNNSWKLASYNNMNAAFLFVPLILIFEVEALQKDVPIFTFSYWFWMTVCGVFGFLISIVTILQIKYTSPLTHNVVGTAKSAFQTILALWIFSNPSTFKGNLGTALTLLGSLCYSYIRTVEDDAKKKSTSPAPIMMEEKITEKDHRSFNSDLEKESNIAFKSVNNNSERSPMISKK